MTTTRLIGSAAIEYAEQHGLSLAKYGDPTEGAREGLSVDEAREVAAQDPALIHLDVAPQHLLAPLTQREGWAREVEYVHQDGARVWLTSGAMGVALDVDERSGHVRGYVVVDEDGLPHGRHTDLDDAAAEAETLGGVEECAYCSANVAGEPEVPALSDDAAWAALAQQHNRGCEWVATRAHRRDAR